MQAGERQLHLGLDARDLLDTKTSGLSSAVAQERRLADPGLAADDEHGTLPAADVLEQPVQPLTLAGAPQQDRTACGHVSERNPPGIAPRESPGATPVDRRESHRVSRTDPVAIVTGGSRGPGRELARKLASRGFAVVVVFLRDQGEAEAVVDGILAADGTAVAVRADVGDALDVERLFDATAAEFGELDVVVHAAVGRTAVVNQQGGPPCESRRGDHRRLRTCRRRRRRRARGAMATPARGVTRVTPAAAALGGRWRSAALGGHGARTR